MNSLNVQLTAALVGRAKGTASNSGVARTLNGRTLNAGFLSTATAGTGGYASNGTDLSRTLAAAAAETWDLRSFTNAVNETAQSLSKLRLLYVRHEATSGASSISVGNSGANALVVLGCLGATAAQLPPGGELILAVPSAAGVTVDGTHKDVKVANNDGANAAAYVIGWWGE